MTYDALTRMTGMQYINEEAFRGVTFVSFRCKKLEDELTPNWIADVLYALVDYIGRRTFVVSLHGVEKLNSLFPHKFAILRAKLMNANGKMAFCCVPPDMYTWFRAHEILKEGDLPNYLTAGEAIEAVQ